MPRPLPPGPLRQPIPKLNLRLSDLIYDASRDEYHHFTTPYHTYGVGVAIPPKKPEELAFADKDRLPASIQALWEFLSLFEEHALGAGLDGVEVANTVTSAAIDYFDRERTRHWHFPFDAYQYHLGIALLEAIQRACWHTRTFRPEDRLIVLEGGDHVDGNPTMVYPMISMAGRRLMDILRREPLIRMRENPTVQNMLTCSLDQLQVVPDPQDQCRMRHENRIIKWVVKANVERLSKPRRVFPNSREEVLRYAANDPDFASSSNVAIDRSPAIAMTDMVGDSMPSSTKGIGELESISMTELLCPKQHLGKSPVLTFFQVVANVLAGRVLFCRVLTAPKLGHGITLGVEDHQGCAMALSIDNITLNTALAHPRSRFERLFPIGCYLAVREPYICLGRLTGIAQIRVTMPTDVEALPAPPAGMKWRFSSPQEHPILTADELKGKGNFAVAAKDYETAAQMYSLGLAHHPDAISPQTRSALLLNRAAVLLANKRPGPALRDCLQLEDEVVAMRLHLSSAQEAKLALRKLEASYTLGLWDTATEALKEAAQHQADPAKLRYYRNSLKRKVQESKNLLSPLELGMGLMQNTGMAPFVGPVDVRDVEGEGRSLVLTSDVKAGEMLLIDTADVDTAYDADQRVSRAVFDVTRPTESPRLCLNEVASCVRAIIADPSLALRMDALTPNPTRESPFVSEAERVAAIRRSKPLVNVDDLHRKFLTNSFGGPVGESGHAANLFTPSSMMNHSCLETVVSLSMGSVKLVWARNDLPAGTELVLGYTPTGRSYTSRTESFRRTWRFICTCPLCVADQKEDYKARERLMEEWPRVLKDFESQPEDPLPEHIAKLGDFLQGGAPPASGEYKIDDSSFLRRVQAKTRPLKEFYDKVKATYAPNRKVPMPDLVKILSDTQARFNRTYPLGSPREGYEELLRVQGCVLSTPAQRRATGRAVSRIPQNGGATEICRPMIMIAGMIHTTGHFEEAASWLRSAYWAYKILTGPVASPPAFAGTFQTELLLCQRLPIE